MALTRREQLIMILATVAVGILIADRFILTPLFENRDRARQLRQTLEAELEEAQATLDRRRILKRRWDQMQEAGLSYDIEKVDSLLFRHLEEASDESGLSLRSTQSERLEEQNTLGQIEFTVSGTGSMNAVTQFLWDIEMAEIPVRIDSMGLGGNNETGSQMKLQMKLSTIYLIEKKVEEEDAS